MRTLSLIGLVKMELPGDTVLWCDGGFIPWASETFTSKDPVFGVIGSIDPLTEGAIDEVPALEMIVLPAGTSTPAQLSQPGHQTSRVRFWIADFDSDTGLLDGTPDLIFDGQIDRTKLTVGLERSLAISVVSLCERMLALNIGNSMNPNFHKSIWAGETGHDQATGLSQQVAWGTETPPGASASYVVPPSNSRSGRGNR